MTQSYSDLVIEVKGFDYIFETMNQLMLQISNSKSIAS